MSELAGARLAIAVTAPRTASFYAGQLAALRAAGAEVHFLSSPSDEVADQCAAERVAFVPIAIERAPSPWADVRALNQIRRELARIRPDLINSGTPKMGLLAGLAAAAQRIPTRVHTLHGLRFEAASGAARAALWSAQRLSCASATHVVCVGPSLRTRARATQLIGPDDGIVIGDGTVNGIDTDRFHVDARIIAAGMALRARAGIARDAVVVGYLGRLARDKGLGDLRRAWERTRSLEAHLLVGGAVDETDSPDAGDLAALRSGRRVTMLGHVDDAATFLAAVDVLVLPTWREGFPTVPLEAAAMGVPVIASDATGCADAIIDGETGALVPVRDPGALTAMIDRYIAEPALRARQGASGAARVRALFTRERIHQLTIDLYRSILTRRSP